jgi:hypothetical protein
MPQNRIRPFRVDDAGLAVALCPRCGDHPRMSNCEAIAIDSDLFRSPRTSQVRQ